MKLDIKNILIGIIIAVVFLMFAVYGTNLIYESPEYRDYCGESFPIKPVINENMSEEERQEQINQETEKYRECQEKYEVARKNYSKNLFIITIIFSIIIIIILIASLFVKVENVSSGLLFGCLMFIIYRTSGFWRYMDDLLRFIILGIVLIILIYIGYKLSKK